MILASMENEQATRVVAGLLAFRNVLMEKHPHTKVPLRVFPLPCKRLL